MPLITYPGQPVTFTREFATVWCGIPSAHHARTAIDLLARIGQLMPAGRTQEHGQFAHLWRPKTTAAEVTV